MHSKLSVPGETVPITRPPSRIRRITRLHAFAILFVSLLVSASPGIAQTYLSSFTGINGPTFVALDSAHPSGTTWLYVSEHGSADNTGTGGGRVLRYNLTTGSTTPQVVATAGNADGQFRSPDTILVDASTGDLFISDRYSNRITRLSVDATTGASTFVMKWGSSTSGAADEMHGPVGMVRDGAGAIYVTEHGDANGAGVAGNVVSKYTIAGTVATRVWRNGNSFNVPYGIAIAGSSLLISDGFNAQVQIWNPTTGTPTGSFSLPGIIPLGLYVDSGGSVWIAESSGNGTGATQRFEKRTAAGAALSSFGTAGTGAGQFMLPFDVAIDSATNRAYASDYSNNRVQVWDLTAAPPAPSISSSTTASATVGTVFSYQITATNSPTSYGATGLAGTGLSVNTSTGAITGTPTAAGTITSTISATNASGTGSATLAITVAAGGGGGDTTPPSVQDFAIDLSTATLTSASFVVTFSEPVTGVDATDFQLNAISGASATITGVTATSSTVYRLNFDYSGSSGSIQGAIKTSATGIIDAASNPFTGLGKTASDPVGVNNGPPADMTAPTVASFTFGTLSGSTVPFTLTFSEAVTGVSPDDIVVRTTGSATGSVASVTGSGTTWTGSATVGGTGTVQLTAIGGATANVRDATTHWFGGGGNASTTALTIGSGGGGGTAPVISSATTAAATVGTAFSYQITATNSPTSYAATNLSGTGLSVSATGAITGTPTTAGTITSTISATNATGTGSATLTITVSAAGAAPVISSSTTAAATVGAAFSYQITATGSPTSYAATNLSGTGLSVSATGAITGTPTTAGTITSTISATNATGTGSATLIITVSAAGGPPVVSSADTASGTVGAAFSYQITATNSPTSYGATGFPTNGLSFNASTGVITGNPTAAGTITSTISATNASGTGSKTLTITITTSGSPPVISSALSASVQTNTGFSYTITASNSPTSFTATNLPAGLSFTSPVISGSVAAAGTYGINISASNAVGTDVKTLVLTVSNPPPPGGGGGGVFTPQTVVFTPSAEMLVGSTLTLTATTTSGNPATFALVSGSATINGNTLTATGAGAIVVRASTSATSVYLAASTDAVIRAKNTQTLAFNSPVTGVIINTPITLSATSSSGLPITFTLVAGDATLSGNVLTPRGPGAIIVRASSAGNDTFAATSVDVNFGSPQKAAQTINLAALIDVTTSAGPFTLSATTSAGLPVTYTVTGPAQLRGNILVLTGAAGTVTVRAIAVGNDSYNALDATRSFAVRALGQQVYLGNIGSDTFAVVVSGDNSRGVFITRFAGSGEAIVAKFTLDASGSFSVNGTSSLSSAGAEAGAPTVAALVARTLSGTVAGGVVTGSIAELGANFSASVQPATGPTASLAGMYTASIPGSASGDTYVVAGPSGQAYAVAVTPFGVTSGTGSFSSSGEFNVSTSGGTIVGSVNSTDGTIRGTLINGSNTAALVGLSEGADRTDRIINLSSRLRTSGEASRAMIAGFVVSGTQPKQMLVRAIGPSLAAFGVQGALANPRLQIYASGGVLIAENEDWGNSADIAAAAANVGAFALPAGSRDAAILLTLDPGAYTAQVVTNGGTGVALIEVYDAAGASASATTRQLINISTRGFVDTGDGSLIAGFVVSGNAPKRVLIRGIGPGLAAFGVQGAVANPTLKLYAAGSSTVIAQNDDWTTAQPINSSQAAATAIDIAAASTATGAFPLASNSRDAAIVITLMPGAYTAVVSDASNGTGAGLVEVYEISNP